MRLKALFALAMFLSGPALATTVTVDCEHPERANYSHVADAVRSIPDGGTVQIAAGLCNEPMMDVMSNQTIVGQGAATTILSLGTFAFRVFGRENVTFKNLRVSPGAGNKHIFQFRVTNHLLIENVVVTDTGPDGNAIEIDGGKYITLRNNRILRTNWHGISLSDNAPEEHPQFVVIEGNTIENATRSCINISGSMRVTVANNFAHHCGSKTFRYGGIRVSNSSETINISSNIISDAARGIFVTSNSKAVAVTGNMIDHSLLTGMLIENASDVVITGNSASDSLGDGIQIWSTVERLNVSGNNLVRNWGWGVSYSGSSPFSGSISGNVLGCNIAGALHLPDRPELLVVNNQVTQVCD